MEKLTLQLKERHRKRQKRDHDCVHKQKILSDKQQKRLECADKATVLNRVETLRMEDWPAFHQAM